jgi:hypothetical protein
MSNTITNCQEWLTYINQRYPAKNLSSSISNLDKVKGFILNREDYPVALTTFFMPTVKDVESFIEELSINNSELYIHLLEEVLQPNLQDLSKEIFDKFLGEGTDKSDLDFRELESHISNLPLHPSVLLHADVKFIEPVVSEN